MKLRVIIVSIFVVLVSISCKKNKESPEIVISTPTEHAEYATGSEVHINASFSDDRGLKSYHVMVGNEAGVMDDTINFMKMGDVEGVSYEFHEHFEVPENAPSMAFIHFDVTDQEDKKTTLKWMIHIN